MSNRDVLIDEKISLSSVVGMGSKRRVVGLVGDTSEERLISMRLSRPLSGLTAAESTDQFDKLELELTEVRSWQVF